MHQRAVSRNSHGDNSSGAAESVGNTSQLRMPPVENVTAIAASKGKGLLLPSQSVYAAIALLPLAGWLMAVIAGVLHFEGIPENKRATQHELKWFDVYVFRTAAGPCLAFIALFLRWAAMRCACKHAASQQQSVSASHVEVELMSRTGNSTVTDAGSRPVNGMREVQAVASMHVQARGLPAPTLPEGCFFRYALVAGQRMIVYGMHLVTMRLAAQADKASVKETPSFLSDHLVLGASVVSCLQVELVCGFSDLTKLDVLGMPLLGHIATSCSMLITLVLACLVSADMYFTAKLFHHPQESLVALCLGTLLFQIPLLYWLQRQKRTICENGQAGERA